MKILCVIDSLGSGGAQRQMVNLACGLKAKGHDVEMFIYFPDLRFFRKQIDDAVIPVHEVRKGAGFSFKVLGKLITLMRSKKYAAVISFLDSPNIYVELARLISFAKLKIVVSERSSFARESGSIAQFLSRRLHNLADAVVANSFTHAEWLKERAWLRNKTHVIYNGYMIPSLDELKHNSNHSNQEFLVIGRVDAGKNGVRLLEALLLFRQRNRYLPSFAWAGRQEMDTQSLQARAEMDRLLEENPDVAAQWQWLGERNDVPQLLAGCQALIHVSLFEGLPNVVCEAFIAGRPVIASNVCDHPILVENGVRGILCDPLSIESICSAIEHFMSLTSDQRNMLGRNARDYALHNLHIDRMISKFEALLS